MSVGPNKSNSYQIATAFHFEDAIERHVFGIQFEMKVEMMYPSGSSLTFVGSECAM
jgi:hypothetical protein